MTKVPLCVFHAHCDDGFGAALAVHTALNGQVELFHGVHQQPPPSKDEVWGRDVILVDFSYKRTMLDRLLDGCRSLLILDHHKTAQEDLAHLPPAQPTWEEHLEWARDGRATAAAALFDMTRSGAMIAWQYFAGPGWEAPLFYQYLQDRDLWRKQLPDGDAFTMALRAYPQDLELWGKFADDDSKVHDLIAEGHTVLRYYRQRIEELKRTAVERQISEHFVPVCNAPYFAASEVAGELAEGHPFAACYFHNGKGWQFSLRSRGDFDVGQFALRFGGGGHAQAAGFVVTRLPWEQDAEYRTKLP